MLVISRRVDRLMRAPYCWILVWLSCFRVPILFRTSCRLLLVLVIQQSSLASIVAPVCLYQQLQSSRQFNRTQSRTLLLPGWLFRILYFFLYQPSSIHWFELSLFNGNSSPQLYQVYRALAETLSPSNRILRADLWLSPFFSSFRPLLSLTP